MQVVHVRASWRVAFISSSWAWRVSIFVGVVVVVVVVAGMEVVDALGINEGSIYMMYL